MSWFKELVCADLSCFGKTDISTSGVRSRSVIRFYHSEGIVWPFRGLSSIGTVAVIVAHLLFAMFGSACLVYEERDRRERDRDRETYGQRQQ